MKNDFDELNPAALDAISERAMKEGIARMFNGIEKLEKPTGPIKPWPSPPEQMVWLKDIFPELAEEAGISITFKDVEKLEPADTKKILGTSEPKPTLENAWFPKDRSASNKKQTKPKDFERD